MGLLDIFREDEECDHEWEEAGEFYTTAGPYAHHERDILYSWRGKWEDWKCKECGVRKRGDRTEAKTYIWYADEIYIGEGAIDKRHELTEDE